MLYGKFDLTYEGNVADNHLIDMYDMSRAIMGLQRSLAITTHLVLNDEVIVRSPSLKGASILSLPSEKGSWKITTIVLGLGTGAYHIGTAPKDTPIGHLMRSAYDYVVKESLGFHVDYKKSLGEQFEELKKNQDNTGIIVPTESQLDSVIEKCQPAIEDMHRPIVFSETAEFGELNSYVGSRTMPVIRSLTRETYDHIHRTEQDERPKIFSGQVTSFNVNTHSGRMYLIEEKRPIPFVLKGEAKLIFKRRLIAESLTRSVDPETRSTNLIFVKAFRNVSGTGILKSVSIVDVSVTKSDLEKI